LLNTLSDLADALHHHQTSKPWPVMALLHPRNIVKHPRGAGFDPSMVAIDALTLTPHGIKRHDGIFEREHRQQLGDGGDFVGFLIDLGLSQYQTLASRKGRDDV